MAANSRDANTKHLQLDTDRAAWRQVADEMVLLDLRDSSYLSVNATGASIWPLLEAGTSREEMLESILAEFEIDQPTAEKDLDQFLEDLRNRDLLKTSVE
ncbi:MAG: PqqD family protein [Pseudomonadales bacterium]